MPGLPPSLTLYGTATTPAAGAAIVSIPNVGGPLWYFATVWALLSGTLAAADQDNLRLQLPAPPGGAGGQQNGPQILLVPTANIWAPPIKIGRLFVPANGAVSVNAIGLGTTGAVYRAILNLDPLVA